ncbi:MAG: TetR family transcriptional regulator C-terminal domain-containing protein [Cypionkella sp.]|nr:TetR family transcriptional regulator C-terminal domain-containing protein [Cypionkella sp.]
MTQSRRPYRRESEVARREALITAALELVAEGGSASATVRAIAQRAGVTPGLIRHYFLSKDELIRAAYGHLMEQMNRDNMAVLETAQDCPVNRLTAFVVASLRPPVVDPLRLGLWAGFIHGVRKDEAMRTAHAKGYHDYRDVLQNLIAALPRQARPETLRAEAIACNAVIDGLWLEGSALPQDFSPGELERIGLTSVGAILGIDLSAALPPIGETS